MSSRIPQIGDIVIVDLGYCTAEWHIRATVLEIRKYKDLFDPDIERTSLYVKTTYGECVDVISWHFPGEE